MYMCVSGIEFAYVWNCSDSVVYVYVKILFLLFFKLSDTYINKRKIIPEGQSKRGTIQSNWQHRRRKPKQNTIR